MNLWVCFLASGLWHGAAWNYVIWGAYNGLFLVLERLFLLRPGPDATAGANAWTFAVTLAGWLVFRATSLDQVERLPGRDGRYRAARRRAGAVPHTADAPPWRRWRRSSRSCRACRASTARRRTCSPRLPAGSRWTPFWPLLFVFALAKALADPFKPFLYFRF